MTMKFGKYKGSALSDIPKSYLLWLYENVELFGELELEVCKILGKKPKENAESKKESKAKNQRFDETEISVKCKQLYRKMSIKYHPDTGGDTLAMQAVNEYNEEIMRFFMSKPYEGAAR